MSAQAETPEIRRPRMTERTERNFRRLAIGTALVIALLATVLSYAGLYSLSIEYGVAKDLAWIPPLLLDGVVGVSAIGVTYSTLAGINTRYPWTLMGIAVTGSVAGNFVAAGPEWGSRILHSGAPIMLALVLEEILRLTRYRMEHEHDLAVAAEQEAAAKAAKEARAASRTAQAPARTVRPSTPATPPPAASPAPAVARTEAPVGSVSVKPVVEPVKVAPVTLVAAAPPQAAGRPKTDKQRILDMLAANPTATPKAIYVALGTDPGTTRRIIRQAREEGLVAAA